MTNGHINYVEFKTHDIALVKKFYAEAFNWVFTDYGPTYTAFDQSGLQGGFELTDEPIVTGALVVLYHDNLESLMKVIQKGGGVICRDIFSFPGGRRFHFNDPSGNELAVWSDK